MKYEDKIGGWEGKGVGRPKGPVKVVYKRRVLPEKVKELDGLLGGREPEIKRESPLEACGNGLSVDALSVENKGLREQQKQLLEDIQRLTDQVAALEVLLEECRGLTYDEKMAYWKARALKAEAYAATKNDL